MEEEALGFWKRNEKEGNREKNNCHISKTIQIYICWTLFYILWVLAAYFFKDTYNFLFQ